MLYILLCGETPFYGDTQEGILAMVATGEYEMDQPQWESISPMAKNLIEQLICYDPNRRLSAHEALSHPWIVSEGEGREEPLYAAASALRAFNSHRKLKRAVLGVMAKVLELEELKELKEVFDGIDRNHDGYLSEKEIRDMLERAGYRSSSLQVTQLLQEVDVGHDGRINAIEFLAAGMQRSLYLKEENLRNVFNYLDKDGSGLINRDELQSALGTQADVDAMIAEADTSGDGKISYEEFKSVMSANHFMKRTMKEYRDSLGARSNASGWWQ